MGEQNYGDFDLGLAATSTVLTIPAQINMTTLRRQAWRTFANRGDGLVWLSLVHVAQTCQVALIPRLELPMSGFQEDSICGAVALLKVENVAAMNPPA